MYRGLPPLSSSFTKQAPLSVADLAAEFIRRTGCNEEQAHHYLRITANNLEKAVPLFLNGEGRQHKATLPAPVGRPGDWRCMCGVHNFKNNKACRRCGRGPQNLAVRPKTVVEEKKADDGVDLAVQFASITGAPAAVGARFLRLFNDNIDEAIQAFFANGGGRDEDVPERYRTQDQVEETQTQTQTQTQESVPPQYFYDEEGVLHDEGVSKEEDYASTTTHGVKDIEAPSPCVLHQELYPIIRGPFSYGVVYSLANDDFMPTLFVPMRRDDVGPNAYEDIARDSVANIRKMLNADFKYPRHWKGHPLFDPSVWYLCAQLSHYGLKREVSKNYCREALRTAALQGQLRVPQEIMELERDLKKQWEESKARQKDKMKRVRKRNDEIVLGRLQDEELVGLAAGDLRMWETVEGRERYRKDAVRGREIEGELKEKMESGGYPRWQVQLWIKEYPKLRERVRHMENIVQAMNDGTFKQSEEYEIYRGVYDAVEKQSLKEHLESLKHRDGLYALANDDENDRMYDGTGPEAFLQDLRDEKELESQRNENKGPVTFRTNLDDGTDGFYAKTIRRERHEAWLREAERDERDNWEMGTPHDYRTAEEKTEDEQVDGRLRELIAPTSKQEEDPWGIASLRGSRGVQARMQYTDPASYYRPNSSEQAGSGWGTEIPHEYRAAQERTMDAGAKYHQRDELDGNGRGTRDEGGARGTATSSGTARGSSRRRRMIPKIKIEDEDAREGSDNENLLRRGLSKTMQEMLAAQQRSFKK